jgi:hypothetical protein
MPREKSVSTAPLTLLFLVLVAGVIFAYRDQIFGAPAAAGGPPPAIAPAPDARASDTVPAALQPKAKAEPTSPVRAALQDAPAAKRAAPAPRPAAAARQEPGAPPAPAGKAGGVEEAAKKVAEGDRALQDAEKLQGAPRDALFRKASEAFEAAIKLYQEAKDQRTGGSGVDAALIETRKKLFWVRKFLGAGGEAKPSGPSTVPGPEELFQQAEAALAARPPENSMAYLAWRQVLESHPKTPWAIKALLRIAELQEQEDRVAIARHEVADEAELIVLLFREGRLESALARTDALGENPAVDRFSRPEERYRVRFLTSAARALRRTLAGLQALAGSETKLALREPGKVAGGRIEAVEGVTIRFAGGSLLNAAELGAAVFRKHGRGDGEGVIDLALFLGYAGFYTDAEEELALAAKGGMKTSSERVREELARLKARMR